jgi:hypothetical protein
MGFYFLVPMSGGTAACILAVVLLPRMFGSFTLVLLLLVALLFGLVVGIGVAMQLVGDWFRARSQARWDAKVNAEMERKRDPVRAALNDYREACDAIDRGF